MEYILIIISAVFVNNIVLTQFLGICPFLGVSNKVATAAGMGGAVLFVMTLASIVTYLIQQYVLVPLGICFLQTITYILVIASLVQMVEIILKKVSPALYKALGVFLPLITTNCAILGVAILVIQKEYNLLQSVVFAISNALGFALALIIFSGIREQLDLADVPEGMKGIPIALIVAGLLSTIILPCGVNPIINHCHSRPKLVSITSICNPKITIKRCSIGCVALSVYVCSSTTAFILPSDDKVPAAIC